MSNYILIVIQQTCINWLTGYLKFANSLFSEICTVNTELYDIVFIYSIVFVYLTQARIYREPSGSTARRINQVVLHVLRLNNRFVKPISFDIIRYYRQEYSDENLMFWVACEKLKKVGEEVEEEEEFKSQVEKIFNQFLTSQSIHEVR